MNNTKRKRNGAATPASRWATIKTGAGRVIGYIEVFRTNGRHGNTLYVTIPGVSRFRDVSITSESDARLEAL
jgi:hypothetical protein